MTKTLTCKNRGGHDWCDASLKPETTEVSNVPCLSFLEPHENCTVGAKMTKASGRDKVYANIRKFTAAVNVVDG